MASSYGPAAAARNMAAAVVAFCPSRTIRYCFEIDMSGDEVVFFFQSFPGARGRRQVVSLLFGRSSPLGFGR